MTDVWMRAQGPGSTRTAPTIYLQQRYVTQCGCGWTSYPYMDESAAITEWREHDKAAHSSDGKTDDG